MIFAKRLPARLLLPLLLSLAPLLRAGDVLIESGEIDGALYQIAKPALWSGDVWVELHGYRPESVPLSAVLPLRTPFLAGLLEEGWMVATTSYRRNGLVVEDAAEDVAALVRRIRERHEPSGIVILEGHSMGGAIAVRLAESRPDVLDGVLCCGAALQVRDPALPERGWTHLPLRPVVFLTNRSETAEPERYAAAVRNRPTSDAFDPVLLTVQRDGHVNLNAAERREALELLVLWIRRGMRPEDGDATRIVDAGPGGARVLDNRIRTSVLELSRIYGNLTLDLRAADLAAIGVPKGERFALVGPGGRFDVLYASGYGDVARGEWVAFDTADGLVMVARNFASAAEAAGGGERGRGARDPPGDAALTVAARTLR
jgi:pimeloyl-ACP methyl ester carboxylesterase